MEYAQSGRPYNSQASSTLGAPTPIDESASKIRDGIGVTEQHLTEIHEAINQMERRLETVLSPMPPSVASTANEAMKRPTSSSHVMGRVDILNDGFAHATQRLRDLMRRIEI